ncbi:SAV_2336 N-terminal domain-related protein [Streptomyces sp. cg28]|uniref:SAV_2336 N-terminal domain-related protein n=1 Tax=Streptomyces sp. cg28 TaxID=3403457 RepID=UPI003B224FE7
MSAPRDPIARLAGMLRTAGLAPTPEEVADALWLGEHITGPGDTATAPAPPRPPDDGPAALDPAPVTDAPAPRPTSGEDGGGTAPARFDRLGLYARATRPADGDRRRAAGAEPEGLPVRVALPAALPRVLDIQRALRPLQRLRPPGTRRRTVLDEAATADASARAMGLTVPVLRPVDRREATLHLVLDASPSMVVWHELFDELRGVCERLGAFRDIQAHYLHGLPDGTPALGAGPDPRGAAHPTDRLRDPTGRSVTIMVSDCAGQLWRLGLAQRLLHRWAECAPVAVLQPLPHRMWRRTHLPAEPGLLYRGEGPGAPLRFRPRAQPLGGSGGRSVPLLPPSASALSAWARLLAGLGARPVPAETGRVHADHPATAPPASAPQRTPAELVSRFRSVASPDAMRLAVYLSAAPLILPVMRLVQRTMLPDSGPAELAEVLLSGLLRRTTETPAEPAAPTARAFDTQGESYAFVPGVRDVLLGPITRDDALLVQKHCSDYVEQRFGRRARAFLALAIAQIDRDRPPGDPAVPPAPQDTDAADDNGRAGAVLPRAFAEVSAAVVRRFMDPPVPSPGPTPTAPGDAVHDQAVRTARILLADHERDGNQSGLHSAAALLRRVLAADPAHEDAGFELGRVLLRLWSVTHEPRLLDEADAAMRSAAAVPGMIRARAVLGQVLYERALAAPGGLDPALLVAAEQEFATVCLAEGVEYELGLDCAVRRARILLRLHRLDPDEAHLRAARAALEEFERREPSGKPDPGLHLALGQVLLALAESTGDAADAGQAARQLTAGLAALGTRAAPVRRARARLDLARALRHVPGALDRALGELALALDEADDDQRLRLDLLICAGRVRRARYDLRRDPADLAAADEAYAAARRLTGRDGHDYASLLPEWADTLLERARVASGADRAVHVHTAVQVLREARTALPRDDARVPARLLALAAGLRLRHGLEHDPVDLREAEYLLAQAARSAGEPLAAARAWAEHGDVQRELHRVTADFGWLEHAADSYRRGWRTALTVSGGPTRVQALWQAARIQQLRAEVLEAMGRPRGALEAYRSALELCEEAGAGEDGGGGSGPPDPAALRARIEALAAS